MTINPTLPEVVKVELEQILSDARTESEASLGRIAVAEEDIKSGSIALNELRALFDSIFIAEQDVTQFPEVAVQLSTGAVNALARSTAFSGWGANFNRVTGDVFNRVEVTAIKRTPTTNPDEQWVRCVFSVHADEITVNNPDPTVIAVGEVEVDPLLDEIGPLKVILRDPVTNEPKTVQDSELADVYARSFKFYNAAGNLVGFGETRATMPDYAGGSFYFSPTELVWKPLSGNPSLQFNTYYQADDDVTTALRIRDTVEFNASRLPKFENLFTRGRHNSIALLGDSWTEFAPRIHQPLRERLIAGGMPLSDSGGYVSANGDISVAEGCSRTRTGNWADARLIGTVAGRDADGGFGPDAAEATGSDGATLTVGVSNGTAYGFQIHYTQTSGGGTISYAAGSETGTVDTAGAESQIVHTVTSTAQSITLTLSGECIISGIYPQNPNGLVFHKLGNGGATAQRYLDIPAEYFQTGLSALAPDVVLLCLGTNDNAQNVGVETFRTNMTALYGRIRAALPEAEIVIIGAGPNGLGEEPINGYNDALSEIAEDDDDTFFYDLQPHFGTFAEADAAGLMHDLSHPSTEGFGGKGGRMIAAALYRAFFKNIA